MKTFLKTFLSDQSGASAAEYALILAIVGVALGAAALALSYQISGAVYRASDTVSKSCKDDAGNPKPCGDFNPTK